VQYCFIASVAHSFFDIDLHYLTFMGRILENKKKLMPVRIMNSVGLNRKRILNSVRVCNNSFSIISHSGK
jgi:hypothetical protein